MESVSPNHSPDAATDGDLVASHPKPSFTSIPVEVRNLIYGNILLEENATVVKKDGSLSFKYYISLFTVSKKISSETLDFFYSRNNFVFIKANLSGHLFKISLAHKIPILVTNDMNSFDKCALKIQLDSGLRTTPWDEWDHTGMTPMQRMGEPYHDQLSSNLISGRSLGTFIRYLNAFVHAELIKNGISLLIQHFYKITFLPTFGCAYYKGDAKLSSNLCRALQTIRIPSKEETAHTTDSFDLKIVVGDGTDSELVNMNQAAAAPLTKEECLRLALVAKEAGDTHLDGEQYLAALAEYTIAELYFAIKEGGSFASKQIVYAVDSLKRLARAYLEYTLGGIEFESTRHEINGMSYRSDWDIDLKLGIRKENQVQILILKGRVREWDGVNGSTSNRWFGESLRLLETACTIIPDHEEAVEIMKRTRRCWRKQYEAKVTAAFGSRNAQQGGNTNAR